MKHLGDITKLNGAETQTVDVICGGSPCQDLSVAGKRAGLQGSRSGLFMDQIRIIKEMRENDRRNNGRADEFIRPRFMVWENVPGAFSSNKGEDFRAVLEETARVADKDAVIPRPPKGKWTPSGAIMGDGWSIAWRVHDAQFWGVPQRRKRIALVADFGDSTAPEILFERESVSRNTEASGEEREGITVAVESGLGETSTAYTLKVRGGREIDSHGHRAGKGALIQTEKSGTLGVSQDQTLIQVGSDGNIAGTLDASYYKGCGERQGRERTIVYRISEVEEKREPILLESNQNHATIQTDGISTALPAAMGEGGGYVPMVCLEGNGSRPSHRGDGYTEGETMYTLNSTEHHAIAIENHPADSRVKISEDGMVQTLSSRMGTGGGNVPMVMEGINGEISGTLDASYYKGCGERQGVEREVVCVGNGQLAQAKISDKVGALNCMHDQQAVITYNSSVGALCTDDYKGPNRQYVEQDKLQIDGSVVRRLTPMECERLQGFPDGWTDIGDWVDSRGKTHKGDADSPRYKALGNSIALPFWQWMARRMVSNLGQHPTMASLFDGIGGFPLVFSRVGCQPVWASEIEEFPIAVTKKRFPE